MNNAPYDLQNQNDSSKFNQQHYEVYSYPKQVPMFHNCQNHHDNTQREFSSCFDHIQNGVLNALFFQQQQQYALNTSQQVNLANFNVPIHIQESQSKPNLFHAGNSYVQQDKYPISQQKMNTLDKAIQTSFLIVEPMKEDITNVKDSKHLSVVSRQSPPAILANTGELNDAQPNQEINLNHESPHKASFEGLENLSLIIKQLFTGGVVADTMYINLMKFEKRLLYYIIKRRFSLDYKEGFESDEVTCNLSTIKGLISNSIPRKPVKCYKYVLKRVLNHLKKKIKAANRTENPSNKLYEFYFRSTAKRLNLPISMFYYPLSEYKRERPSFNLIYFSRIFQSDEFVEAVEDYLQDKIMEDFKEELEIRVNSMIRKWTESLKKAKSYLEMAETTILEYIIYNKRWKLPWNENEVSEAVMKVNQLVKKYSPKYGEPLE